MPNISDAKDKTTQSADWRPSATSDDVRKVADVVPRIPHIINYVLKEADTWYEIKFPPNTVTWMIRARTSVDLDYTFEPSGSTYMTLNSGTVLTENTVPNRSIWSVFVRCGTADTTVEIEVWLYA